MNVTPQHAGFQQRLEQSDEAVLRVATAFRKKGYTVQLPPLRVAPTAAEASDYRDNGDMHAFKMHRIEVKWKPDRHFIEASDWPHPDVFIASTTFVNDSPDVVMYVVMSADYCHCAAIHKDTREQWVIHTDVWCKNTGNREDFYACPTEFIRYRLLDF